MRDGLERGEGACGFVFVSLEGEGRKEERE